MIYEELERKLLKYQMRLDLYHMVKHLLKFHSKETMLAILKSHQERIKTNMGKNNGELGQANSGGHSKTYHPQ